MAAGFCDICSLLPTAVRCDVCLGGGSISCCRRHLLPVVSASLPTLTRAAVLPLSAAGAGRTARMDGLPGTLRQRGIYRGGHFPQGGLLVGLS